MARRLTKLSLGTRGPAGRVGLRLLQKTSIGDAIEAGQAVLDGRLHEPHDREGGRMLRNVEVAGRRATPQGRANRTNRTAKKAWREWLT